MTPQRLAVLDVVREAHDHPTAAEIYRRVKQRLPHISYATVYNALSALVAQGEIRELFEEKARRYDSRVGAHDHAVCLGCNRLMDVDSFIPDSLLARAASASGFRITGHHTEYFGYCPDCRATAPSPSRFPARSPQRNSARSHHPHPTRKEEHPHV